MRTGKDWNPPGFQVVERPGARVLARPEAVPWVRYVLDGGQGLHSAARHQRGAVGVEGRTPVFIIPAQVSSHAPDGSGTLRWAVRHYTRGGKIMSRLLHDRYLLTGTIRPYHEIHVSQEARSRGIPTPRVVAAALYPSGLFYRGDLVTEFIPDSVELVDALFDTRRKGAGGAAERLDVLRETGSLIRRMAGVGLRHRDLHAGNILLEWQGASPRSYLLDLDRCEISHEGKPVPVRPMFQRLRRSLLKWERETGTRITDPEWRALENTIFG